MRFHSCSSSSSSSSSASTSSSGSSSGLGASVTIGVDQPLSGSIAGYGQPEEKGAEYAAYVANQQKMLGSTQVKLNINDDAGTNSQAVVNVSKLVASNAVAVFGSISQGLATVPITAKAGMLNVVTQNEELLLNSSNTNTYNLTPPGVNSFPPYAKYLQSQGVKTASLVVDPAFTDQIPLAAAATKDFAAVGITIKSTVQASDAAASFTPQASKLASQNPGAIVFIASGVTPIMLGELRNDGWKGIALAYNAPASVFASGGAAMNGLIQATYFTPLSTTPAVQTFTSGYTKWGGSAPTNYTADAYDSIMSIIQAIKAANSTSRSAILAAYANMAKQGFSGVEGQFTFNTPQYQNRRAELPVILIEFGSNAQPAKILPTS